MSRPYRAHSGCHELTERSGDVLKNAPPTALPSAGGRAGYCHKAGCLSAGASTEGLVQQAPSDAEKQHEQTPASEGAYEGYDDSRGGTRTRDPGIMSAVL